MKSGWRLGPKHLQFDRFLSVLKIFPLVYCVEGGFFFLCWVNLRLCIYYISALQLSYMPSPWFFETDSYCVDQADVKLEILLPQVTECWYRAIYHHVQLLRFLFRFVL